MKIASLNAHMPIFYGAAWSSAKAGVEMLTKNAAQDASGIIFKGNCLLR